VKVLLFGATGMVGAGVLRECLKDPRVEHVLAVGRHPCGLANVKLEEILHADFFDYGPLAARFTDRDACFFCLGVSSAGMSESDYRRRTYDLTLAAANALVAANPRAVFCYVSGAGTDSSEHGRMMWARVKGETENALLRLPFAAAYMFRPGYIQPLEGVRSKTALYQVFYTGLSWLYPLLRRLPAYVTSTVTLGRAMIAVAAGGHPSPILESRDINRLGVGRVSDRVPPEVSR
jgi:uncharacterized protein YbjT (DUF2867 family)